MRYFIYARKSTEDDDRQILSIEAQLTELREFAAKEKFEVVASFCEAKTAKEPGRIVFGEMLKRIEKGEVQGIISWHPDRLARNSVDGGRIIHMIDRGLIKGLKFPTFWFEPTPQGLFMLQIAFGQSKYYVDNLRENVKRGLRQKIRNGVWPSWAPVGYLNNPKTRGIDVDAKKAQKVKEVFEFYASSRYTLREIAEKCHEIGLTGNKGQRITINQARFLLSNIFYIGLMKYTEKIYEGTHEPIISKKLFDKIQKMLNERGKPKNEKKHYFAFLGLMKCASCGCSITAEIQKGHHYYRCTKKKKGCHEKHYFREEALIQQIKTLLQKVSLSSHDTEKVLFELEKDEALAKEQAKTTVQNLEVQLAEIETKLEKLLDVYLGEVITAEEYAPRKEKLVKQKIGLQEQIRDFEQNGLSWLEPARECVKSLNQAAKLVESENYPEITTFLKNIGSNHILHDRQFRFVWAEPYDKIAERSEAHLENLPFPEVWPILVSARTIFENNP